MTERRAGVGLAVAIVAAYLYLGLVVVDPESLFSIDAAIKLLQAQSLRDSGFQSVALRYPAQDLDPDQAFLPFGEPFVFRHHGALQGVYPVAVAAINAVALCAGLPGLVWLSALSALAALLLTRQGVPRGGAVVTLMLGLGTPFWAYGLLPWEHMPALACATLAGVLLEGRSGSRTMLAGCLLGLAVALRGEFALLVPGLAVVHFRALDRARVVAMMMGLAAPLLLAGALDTWVYDRPAFSHISHAVDVVWKLFGAGSSVARPEALPLVQKFDVIIGLWLFGLPNGWVLCALLLALVASGWLPREARQLVVLVALVGASVLVLRDLWTFVRQPEFVAGLLRGSPILLFAFLPAGLDKSPSRERTSELSVLLIFILGLLVSGRHAGAQIGPRFMLPLFPLMAKMAWEGLHAYRTGPRGDYSSRLTWILGLVLLAGSVGMQLLVGLPAYLHLNAQQQPIVRALGEATPAVIVLSDMYLINHAATSYGRARVMLVRTEAAATALSGRLVDAGIREVGLIRSPDATTRLPGFLPGAAARTPYTSLELMARP